MQSEVLNIAVLYGTGGAPSSLPEILKSLPQLQVLAYDHDPENFLRQPSLEAPDSVLVYLDGNCSPPEWLELLTLTYPQTSVLICSPRREPDFLIRAMQLGVREFLPLPLAQSDLEAALERVRAAKRRLSAVSVSQGKLVVVTGYKGGVGATTVAVNLAMALATMQVGRIVLVDLGRPFPDVGNLLDQEAPYNLLDLVHNIKDLDQEFIQKIVQPYEDNLGILHGIPVKEQGSFDLDILDRVFASLRHLYQWTIVDLDNWLDELFVRVMGEADLALVLTELTVMDIRNLSSLLPMLREWQLTQNDRLKIVVNRYSSGKGLALRDVEQTLQRPAFFSLPSDYPALTEAANQGVPLVKVAPRSKLSRSLQNLAQELTKLNRETMGAESAAGSQPRRRFRLF